RADHSLKHIAIGVSNQLKSCAIDIDWDRTGNPPGVYVLAVVQAKGRTLAFLDEGRSCPRGRPGASGGEGASVIDTALIADHRTRVSVVALDGQLATAYFCEVAQRDVLQRTILNQPRKSQRAAGRCANRYRLSEAMSNVLQPESACVLVVT